MNFAGIVTAISAVLPVALACNGYTGGVPKAVGTRTNSKAIEVPAGQVYDGQWYRFDRGSGACSGQTEGGTSHMTVVLWTVRMSLFLLKEGAILRNVIISKNQAEGVHCQGHCTLEFVGFEDVGGAYHASDKIVQHNGCGTLYRSCGNCSKKCERNVYIEGVTAVNGGELAGINSNYEDTATIKNACADTSVRCQMYTVALVATSPRRPVPAPAKLRGLGRDF
ncbi:pectate lyase C [Clathrospora elynae]|uniref:Pectate lyase n=1 Tax=Clathrospora elynae TaxID=706981 RepID=A0A6A5SDN1_9PLEO|nr:pectate lyase C [Clathrospora elynae]